MEYIPKLLIVIPGICVLAYSSTYIFTCLLSSNNQFFNNFNSNILFVTNNFYGKNSSRI